MYKHKEDDDIEFTVDNNGVAHRVYKLQIYFGTEHDRMQFENWLKGEGGDLFTEYQEKLKREYPRMCFECKWFDQGNDQCFNGHLQYADRETCEGFEVVT